MEKEIILAGGCFWGVEKYFSLVKGVVNTKVGYANGNLINPKYEDLKSGLDSSSEEVRIIYNDDISLIELLKLYLIIVDPYSLNKQGEDEGIQYRTGIYYTNPSDEAIIKEYLKKNLKDNYKIEVLPLNSFYDAETYHQKYLEKNPGGYCHINMNKLPNEYKK